MDKKTIRTNMLQQREGLSRKQCLDMSSFIINKLKEHPFYIEAQSIGIYVSFKNEVETYLYLQSFLDEKEVAITKITDLGQMEYVWINQLEDLEDGKYGIKEPKGNTFIDPSELDLLIIPLVAFDNKNNRIGYGGGYYDRYLQRYKGNTIGLGYSFQKVDIIPIDIYDKPLDNIIY